MENDFYEKAVAYIRRNFKSAALSFSDEDLTSRIEKGCETAASYGFETEADAMAFVDIQWRMGEDFYKNEEKYPWVKEVLDADFLDIEDKITKLRELYAMSEAYRRTANG